MMNNAIIETPSGTAPPSNSIAPEVPSPGVNAIVQRAIDDANAARALADTEQTSAERLEALMERFFNTLTVATEKTATGGDVAVIPTTNTTANVIPYLLVAGGIGFAVWTYYKRRKGASE